VFLIGRSPPDGSDLEDLYTLPGHTEGKIHRRANVWRWPTLLHEGVHRPAYSRQFDLGERHGQRQSKAQVAGVNYFFRPANLIVAGHPGLHSRDDAK